MLDGALAVSPNPRCAALLTRRKHGGQDTERDARLGEIGHSMAPCARHWSLLSRPAGLARVQP